MAAGTPIAGGMKELIHLSPFWSETSGRYYGKMKSVWLVRLDDRSFCMRYGTDLLSTGEQERGPRGSNFK